MPRSQLPERVVGFLRGIGLTVRLDGGTVYVTRGAGAGGAVGPSSLALPIAPPITAPPQGSPLAPPTARAAPAALGADDEPRLRSLRPASMAILTPSNVGVAQLVDAFEPLFPQLTLSARTASAVQGERSRILPSSQSDFLVIAGDVSDVEQAVALGMLLDVPRPMVEIRAAVFEVGNTTTRTSALSVLANVAGATLQSVPTFAPGEQLVRFSTGGISAVLSATRGDGRFKVLALPSLAVLSGSVATLNSGSQVPTLGAVSFSDQGVPIRSVEYRDSGITLTVRPVARASGIELAVEQERSSFVRTTTGVNESPTLNRASASTTVVVQAGETLALGGLSEESSENLRSGFFGGLLGGSDRSESRSQLVLLIEATLLEGPPPSPLAVSFVSLGPGVLGAASP